MTAGPIATVAPETVAIVQSAILAGCCVEFHYATDDRPEPRWRRVIPYGLVHGPLTYLLGKMPGRDDQPVYFRLDRMMDAEVSDTLGRIDEREDLAIDAIATVLAQSVPGTIARLGDGASRLWSATADGVAAVAHAVPDKLKNLNPLSGKQSKAGGGDA